MTLTNQHAAAQRELALRESCYPRWVANGRMSKAKADHEIACMAAIVQTLGSLLQQQRQPDLFDVPDR